MMYSVWTQFQMGGFMMYVVFACGLVAVASALRFAVRGEHQLLGFLRWMLGVLLASGALGFVTGMVRVFHFAKKQGVTPDLAPEVALLKAQLVVLEGTGEALNCVVASFLFVALLVLVIAIGHRRFPEPNPSALL